MPSKKGNKTKAVRRDQLDWARRLADETGFDLDPDSLEDAELDALQDELEAIPLADGGGRAKADALYDDATAAIGRGDIDAARESIDALVGFTLDELRREAEAVVYRDVGSVHGAEAARLRQAVETALGRRDLSGARRAVDALELHAATVRDGEKGKSTACHALLGQVDRELEVLLARPLPPLLATAKPFTDHCRGLHGGLKFEGGTSGLEERIGAFRRTLALIAGLLDARADDLQSALDPRHNGLKPIADACAAARTAAAAVDGAGWVVAATEVARLGALLIAARNDLDALAAQIDGVQRRMMSPCGVLVKIAAGLSESAQALHERSMQAPPQLVLERLLDGRAVAALRGWVDERRNWAVRADGALADAELLGDLRAAFTTVKGVAMQREALMAALCDFAGSDDAIDAAYQALLQTKGPWRERAKRETQAQPAIIALVALHVDAAVARKLALAALVARLNAEALVRGSGVAVATTLADLVNRKGARQALLLMQAIGSEAGLRRFLDHSDVTPANLLVLEAAGDLVLTVQPRLIGYTNCRFHRGQREVEAGIDAVWRWVGVDAAWGVIHVHYCSGLGNPVQRTTAAAAIGYCHVKANGNFGGSGGEITDGGLKGRLAALIGLQTL